MNTSVKALVVSTTSSLIAAVAVTTAGIGPAWAWWTAWAILAVGTVAVVVADRRQST
ncbi:hypothetical protein V2W30_03965 [Streptomyces sp. Q6]|uniref:Uncharacterized protein n=1 Tax=Streptomyces citrinus TaxID=3118173 RepID=A0ACD5A5W5_9ACTN